MGIKKKTIYQRTKRRVGPGPPKWTNCPQVRERNNISPSLINRWKRQYLNGQLGNKDNNQKINKLQKEIAKLEQMIGKLT